MKKTALWIMALLCLLSLTGCGAETPPSSDGERGIPFRKGLLYAAAYLGYGEMEDLSHYTQAYLEGQEPPVYHLSEGEYYLIIPRYEDTALELYRSDVETMGRELVCEDPGCRSFVVRCNVSDIFPDAVISLTHGEETVEFSPYISLEDGSVQVGERGMDITEREQG